GWLRIPGFPNLLRRRLVPEGGRLLLGLRGFLPDRILEATEVAPRFLAPGVSGRRQAEEFLGLPGLARPPMLEAPIEGPPGLPPPLRPLVDGRLGSRRERPERDPPAGHDEERDS